MLHSNLSVNEQGHLTFAGVDTTLLAKKYGTPLFVMDEERIRNNMRTYIAAMNKYFGEGSRPLFASKSLCVKRVYEIAKEENMSIDIVSSGELYTARAAGFPLERAYFHGNNKTDADIAFALDCKLGYFVVDNKEELDEIQRQANERGLKQKILLRLSPGIDPHTHAKISTGSVDSKFGTAIETGQAEELVRYALSLSAIDLQGFHSHIGSQIFDCEPFCDAADIMLEFVAQMKQKLGFEAKCLNLGGGFGVRYVEDDPVIDIPKNIQNISQHVKECCARLNIDQPNILMEPGRSIVADAGITLYSVGSVKSITGYKNYVSVDGGMTDNPRYALYQSQYSILLANRANDEKDFTATVAGRCCESGDLIAEDVALAKPQRNDILAVLVTGAYNYAMSSNYNRIPRPAMIMLDKNGRDYLALRRETFEDVCSHDV